MPDPTVLVQAMRALGYPANQGGVCYGLAYKGGEAFLLMQSNQFNERLNKIKKIVMAAEALAHPELKIGTKVAKAYSEKEQQIIINYYIKEKLSKDNEIRALFDSIMLYHQSHEQRYKDLFQEENRPISQNAQLVMPLTLSAEMENRGGIQVIDKYSGVYSDLKELTNYFQCIYDSFADLVKLNPPQAFSLAINNSKHAINVGYDPILRKWQIIDSENIPVQFFNNAAELAQAVSKAFSGCSILKTEILVAGDIPINQKKLKENLRNTEIWRKIHEITKDKAEHIDALGTSWLYQAVTMNDVETVNALLPYADVNKKYNGISLLSVAIQHGNAEVGKLLIEHGAVEDYANLKILLPMILKEIEQQRSIETKEIEDKNPIHLHPKMLKLINELEEYQNEFKSTGITFKEKEMLNRVIEQFEKNFMSPALDVLGKHLDIHKINKLINDVKQEFTRGEKNEEVLKKKLEGGLISLVKEASEHKIPQPTEYITWLRTVIADWKTNYTGIHSKDIDKINLFARNNNYDDIIKFLKNEYDTCVKNSLKKDSITKQDYAVFATELNSIKSNIAGHHYARQLAIILKKSLPFSSDISDELITSLKAINNPLFKSYKFIKEPYVKSNEQSQKQKIDFKKDPSPEARQATKEQYEKMRELKKNDSQNQEPSQKVTSKRFR